MIAPTADDNNSYYLYIGGALWWRFMGGDFCLALRGGNLVNLVVFPPSAGFFEGGLDFIDYRLIEFLLLSSKEVFCHK